MTGNDLLSEQVRRAEAVLALVWRGWAEACHRDGSRRSGTPDHFVRVEIEAAFWRDPAAQRPR